jgi:hypothetical protein
VKLGTVKKIEGPPVLMKKNADSFIKTHIDSQNTVSGPWIEDTKWWFLVKRKYTNAKTLLKESLNDGGLQVGVSKNLASKIQINHKLLTNLEIHEYLTEDFKKFLYNFLRGRPEWYD